jgi:ABC-type amino acid transport substrate-binding protein
MARMPRLRWMLLTLAIATAPSVDSAAAADTIAKIRADQTIRIGYREDAPPFSHKVPGAAEPTGFVVNLCQVVVKHLAEQLRVPALKISYVAVTAANRFDAVERRDVDLLCEPTSVTLARRQRVDFSIPTFVDGASLLTRDTSIGNLRAMAGRKIGVLTGTTTEQRLRGFLRDNGIAAEVIPASTHEDGLAMIDADKVTAYFADQTILLSLLNQSKDPAKLAIAQEYLSMEVYALALARGDSEFRLAVDTALSRTYRGGEVGAIFDRTFGGNVRPTPMLRTLYQLSTLPD